jgi:hypothetical protein
MKHNMKRILALTLALLTLTMMLTLAACGGGDTDTTDDTSSDVSTVSADKDLTAIRDQIISDCGIQDTLMIETEALESLYGITADQVAASAGFTSTDGAAAFPQEVVMIQAVDETAAADIQTKLENHLSNIAETAASYDPDSLSLAENCPVVTDGTYVALFFSSNYDTMVADFQG